jgi:hypothetical protein
MSSESGSAYTGLSDQISYMVSDGKLVFEAGNDSNYLVRADGAVDRTKGDGKISHEMSNPADDTRFAVARAHTHTHTHAHTRTRAHTHHTGTSLPPLGSPTATS